MDFLESPWNKPDAARLNYTQSYSTQNNQVNAAAEAWGGQLEATRLLQ